RCAEDGAAGTERARSPESLPPRGCRIRIRRLRPGGAGGRRENADELPHPAAILEPDNPVDEGEQRVVAPQPDVVARLEACPPLADQDGASGDELAAIALDSQSLGVAVATVA